ncbi:hypothetical protein ACQPYK_18985 [Streptosporangium sp. CA-135522]|uniref:hypothetical protein n=1 Tax=Streptosporangium sp. CA-135522 TaxID=3240072 RepID=UPI003D8E5E24
MATDTLTAPGMLESLADRIAETAHQARNTSGEEYPTGPEALIMLAEAMRDGGGALAGVDLLNVYPPEALLPDRRAPGWEAVLTLLRVARDIMIFLPVFITWLMLQKALTAYGEVKSPPPFLAGWQAGTFGGRSFTPLSDAAMAVALFVALVMACAAAVHLGEGYVARLTSNDRARHQLAQDLALATLLIAPVPEDVRLSIREVARQLPVLRSSTAQLVLALERTSDEIRAALEGGPGQQISDALNTWVAKSAALESALSAVQIPTTTLQEFEKLQRRIHEDQQAVQRELNGLVTRIQSISDGSDRQVEAARQLVISVMSGLGDSLNRFGTGVDDLAKTTEQLRRFVDAAQRFVIELRDRDDNRADW